MVDAVAVPLAAAEISEVRRQAIRLFVVGFLVLFLELACIRWLASYVIFLQFFTNIVLIASFLGMSCGCLAARRRQEWLHYFPLIALGTIVAAFATTAAYHFWSGLAVDIGGQNAPQEVFFGTEYRNPDVAKFVVPIEAIAGVFFVLVALMFVGLGQVLGRAFDGYPNRVLGYTLNIGGSMAGIAGFSALSFVQAPPGIWFLIGCAGVAYLLHQESAFSRPRALALVALVAMISIPSAWLSGGSHVTRWSPYYMVDHDIPHRAISVGGIAHQTIVPFASAGAPYSLIHLLQKHSGGAPFHDMLVIGAGSGNDLAHALKFGAERIDAVEIDPVIQDIGRHYHPDHPYQDPRVIPHLDDGRHYLRTTDHKYDLVAYALVDSLILHSGYANIRLESYLFTQQAFDEVRRVLKPGGTFVMYNFFRQGWIVERIAAMMEETFGCKPTVISLPYQEKLSRSFLGGFTMIIGGCNPRIADAFAKHQNFWLNTVPPKNLDIDGFAVRPDLLPAAEQRQFMRIAPTSVASDPAIASTSDDWPFLYLHGRLIPDFTLRSMVLIGLLGLGMVYLFLPGSGIGRRIAVDNRMFFLGAAFMLLETKAVVQMALLFGSTWLVNSAVFFTVLLLILLANLYVLKCRQVSLFWHYLGLAAVLAVGALVPLDVFLDGGILWRYVVPCAIALGPMLFAGVIFARSFKNAAQPDLAFGSNIAGAVVGGLAESLSMLLGFQHLLLVALAFYLISAWSPRSRPAAVARA
jgi:SAM-dependent methyltransferase